MMKKQPTAVAPTQQVDDLTELHHPSGFESSA